MIKIFQFILFGIILLSISSCKDQYDFSTDKLSDDIHLNPALALPLVDAKISIDEFLNTTQDISFLQIDNDKFMSLIYEFEVSQVPATSYFKGTYEGTLPLGINYTLDRQIFNLGIKKPFDFDEFYVASPKATFTLHNYWNIPVTFRFTEFNYYANKNSVAVPATGTFFSTTYTIKPPVAPKLMETTSIELNTSNSNIDQIISTFPDHFSVAASIQTQSGATYKVDPLSVDSVSLKVEIPLDFRVKNLILVDTAKIDIGNNLGSDTSMFESLKLNLIIENGFPVDIDAQLYFTDKNYIKLDSLSTDGIKIVSGQVTAGKVDQTTKSTLIFDIVGKKREAFLKASNLLIKYKINTANSQSGGTVKIYSTYKIGFKAGALIKLKLEN